jgi:tetratricopeptide (TPR) repeat protein/transposase
MTTLEAFRIRAVETYIENGESLRKTSRKLMIPHLTLWRWVKWYKQGGKENLKRRRPYQKPWNRPSKKVEEKVMMIKERNPAITLKATKEMLERDHIKMSLKGIWSIWKRYALTGRSKTNPYTPFGPLTPEAENSLKSIRKLLKDRRIQEAAKVVNKLPSFPVDPILKEIPEEFLSPRRKLDRLFLLFGKIPLSEDYRKARIIRITLEKKGLLYSSISAGFRESLPLNWMMSPAKELDLITHLKERAKGIRDPSLRFLLFMHEGLIHADYLDYKKAKACIGQCVKLLRFLPYSFFFDSIGTLMTHITDYKNAFRYYRKTFDMQQDEDHRRILLWKIALTHAIAGRYKESIKILGDAEKKIEGSRSAFEIIRAYSAFGQGDLLQASSLFKSALEKSEKGNLRNHLHAASLGLAGIQIALGNEKEAKVMLVKYLALFRKYRMKNEVLLRNILLKNVVDKEKTHGFPLLHLFSILHTDGYQKALDYANNKGLFGFFHRTIVFFPEPVLAMLEKGKDTGLPRAILNFPVFRKEIPVYSVKFLGNLIIHKNQKYLPTRLAPKAASFIIYLASQRVCEVSLEKLYDNFWQKSTRPSRNLAHLLVRIRKALRLPPHFLYVKEGKLFFECYFTTDYGEYQEHLVQAKALLRAGEWGFAKREFIKAFDLFREEPLKKMYDNWSDDKRLEILFSYENEILSFAKKLLKKGKKPEAKRLLKKAEKIIPFSDEIRNF